MMTCDPEWLDALLRTLETRPWFGGRLLVSRATGVFNAEGQMTDEGTKTKVREFMAGFTGWTEKTIDVAENLLGRGSRRGESAPPHPAVRPVERHPGPRMPADLLVARAPAFDWTRHREGGLIERIGEEWRE